MQAADKAVTMKRSYPIAALSALAFAGSGSVVWAASQPTNWGEYERTSRPDGTLSPCLKHRRGVQGAGDAKWIVFQMFDDCNRRVQAACDATYTPSCTYGADVVPAANLDAVLEAYGESPTFGHFVPVAVGRAVGCFLMRCREADPAPAPAPSGPRRP